MQSLEFCALRPDADRYGVTTGNDWRQLLNVERSAIDTIPYAPRHATLVSPTSGNSRYAQFILSASQSMKNAYLLISRLLLYNDVAMLW